MPKFKFGLRLKMNNEYDRNGNMTWDNNKVLHNIQYNYLNLPELIDFGSDRYIVYAYDAAVTKLSKDVISDGVSSITDYVGNLIYENGLLSMILTEEGRITVNTDNGEKLYEYFLKDHLGNTRATFCDADGDNFVDPATDELLQEDHYYPFGMRINGLGKDPSGIKNKYMYNGKELQDDHLAWAPLDWYDYGARLYDPSLGRWHAVDPYAEYYEDISPYAYVENNPVFFIDPNGKEVVEFAGRYVITGDDVIHYLGALQAISDRQSSMGNLQEALADAARQEGGEGGHFQGMLLAEDTPSQNPSLSPNNKTGHIYNKRDLKVRNSIVKRGGPIARYLHSEEVSGNYDVLNSHDYWMKYGHTLGNLMLMDTYVTQAVGLAAAAQGGGNQVRPNGPKCFIGNTLIETKNKFKLTKDISIKDKVWSYNEEEDKWELKKVVATKTSTTNRLIRIEVGDDTLFCTPEHPFYIEGNWIKAQNLVIGSKVKTLRNDVLSNQNNDSKPLKFCSIETISVIDTNVTVYNFEVVDNHNYLVGTERILVHNNCGISKKILSSDTHVNLSKFKNSRFKQWKTEKDHAGHGVAQNIN